MKVNIYMNTGEEALEAAAKLWVEMIKEIDPTLTPNPEWWKAEVEEFQKERLFELAVAYEGGRAVGFANGIVTHMPATGKIAGFCRDIYVMPHLRGQGVFEQLIEKLEKAAEKHGIDTVYIYCDPKYQRAWERMGFKAERLMMRRS